MKNIISFKGLLLLIFVLIITNNAVALPDLDRSLLNSLENIYSFKFNEATKNLNEIIKNHPEDPRGYHYMAELYLWYYLGGKNKDDYNAFISYADKSIEKCNLLLKDNPDDEDLNLIIGNTYTFKSVVLAQANSYVDAAWAGNKSENYLKKVLEINKNNHDAYFGLGLFKFAVSQVPSTFQWVLKMAGIKGDKNLGLKFIKEAATKGKFCKVEAQYFLAQLQSAVLNNNNDALNNLTALNKKYPSNVVFSYATAVINMKKHNLDRAEALLNDIVETKNEKLSQVVSFSNFLLGDINFRRNEFEKAKKWYNSFLDMSNGSDYKGIAVLRLGICTEITGSRDLSTHYYMVSDQGNTDLDDDIYAKRFGAKLIKNPLTPAEIDLIKGYNLINCGKYKEAIEILNKVAAPGDSYSAEAEYYLSEAYFYLNNLNESLNHSLKVVKLSTEEKWVIPFSFFNAARVYKAQNDFEKMDDMINEADEFNDFDYENKLNNLLSSLK